MVVDRFGIPWLINCEGSEQVSSSSTSRLLQQTPHAFILIPASPQLCNGIRDRIGAARGAAAARADVARHPEGSPRTPTASAVEARSPRQPPRAASISVETNVAKSYAAAGGAGFVIRYD